jgi:hypothetical protein
MSRAPPCEGGARRAQQVEKSLQNDRLDLRSVDLVLLRIFALVDPWWTLARCGGTKRHWERSARRRR